jgi:hypothetical protein
MARACADAVGTPPSTGGKRLRRRAIYYSWWTWRWLVRLIWFCFLMGALVALLVLVDAMFSGTPIFMNGG